MKSLVPAHLQGDSPCDLGHALPSQARHPRGIKGITAASFSQGACLENSGREQCWQSAGRDADCVPGAERRYNTIKRLKFSGRSGADTDR